MKNFFKCLLCWHNWYRYGVYHEGVYPVIRYSAQTNVLHVTHGWRCAKCGKTIEERLLFPTEGIGAIDA